MKHLLKRKSFSFPMNNFACLSFSVILTFYLVFQFSYLCIIYYIHYQQHETQLITPTFLKLFLYLTPLKKVFYLVFPITWMANPIPLCGSFSTLQILTAEILHRSSLGSPLLSSIPQFHVFKYHQYIDDYLSLDLSPKL